MRGASARCRPSRKVAEQDLELVETTIVLENGAEFGQPSSQLRDVEPGAMNREQLLGVIEILGACRDQLVEHQVFDVGNADRGPANRHNRAALKRFCLEREPREAEINGRPDGV